MQSNQKKTEILDHVIQIVAREGVEHVSMRHVASAVDVVPSVLYHYFENKEALLFEMYQYANSLLGQQRAALPVPASAEANFKQLIRFQFEHAEKIVAVLKYYFSFREDFAQIDTKRLPKKATLHVEEVIQAGVDSGAYCSSSIDYARQITHTINGYLLEYYPYVPAEHELQAVIDEIYDYIAAVIERNHS